jgi:hypothetical protein
MESASVALLVVAIVVVVVFLRSRTARRPSTATPGTTAGEPSIHQQIRDRLRASPNEPLNVAEIRTDDPVAEGRIRFAAGAMDALFGHGRDGTEWKAVLDVVRSLGRGEELHWTAIDAVIAEVPTASNVDLLIEQLRPSDATPVVRKRFWEVAQKSRRTESVKWGIAIGGIGLRPDEVEPLLALAHHAEFTLYAAHVLMREGARDPRYRRRLVDLLPRARQWGVIRLIDYIVSIEDLIADVDVQRSVLVHGMENCDGIAMEVAFTIAEAVDIRRLIAAGRDDDRLRRAVSDLMNTLLTEPNPLGGLIHLDGWETIYDAWVDFLEQHDSDANLLGSLRSLLLFLKDDGRSWTRGDRERDRIERLWKSKFSAQALRDGLYNERDRWLTLEIVVEQEVRELLPDVRTTHAKKPDYSTINVLAKIGSEEDLEALRASIGGLVDLDARKRIPRSTENVFGPEHRHSMEYGLIVRAMARLATPDAVTTIKTALFDYDPYVRSAACNAVADLAGDLVDDEIRAAVRARVNDSPNYVAESARHAANVHGIQ